MGIRFIKKLSSSPRWNVWLGEMNGQKVVVKAPAFTITPREIEHYGKRATIWWELKKNPNVAEFIAYNKKNAAFITKYYPKTLRQILERRKRLPIGLAIGIALGIANALREAHGRGVVHGDIKPENVFLDEANTPKLGDWEDAIILIEDDNVIQYTPRYEAPEQKLGDMSRVDERTDIYQLGILLYEMIEGEKPVVLVYKRTPEYLRDVISRCLMEKPDERYQTVDELISELRVEIPRIGVELTEIEAIPSPAIQPKERQDLEQTLKKWGVASVRILAKETGLDQQDIMNLLELADYAVKSKREEYWYHKNHYDTALRTLAKILREHVPIDIERIVKDVKLFPEDIEEQLRIWGYPVMNGKVFTKEKLIQQLLERRKIVSVDQLQKVLGIESADIESILRKIAYPSRKTGYYYDKKFWESIMQRIYQILSTAGKITKQSMLKLGLLPEDIEYIVKEKMEPSLTNAQVYYPKGTLLRARDQIHKIAMKLKNVSAIAEALRITRDDTIKILKDMGYVIEEKSGKIVPPPFWL